MLLPEVINYLLSLEGFTNSPVRQGAFQTIINPFPPNTTVSFSVRPPDGTYAHLSWINVFGSEMIPNAFSGFVQQYGSRPFSGIITAKMLEYGVPHLVVVTDQQPTEISVTNNTALNQYFEAGGLFLAIASEPDLQIVIDALRRLHTSSKLEALTQESNALLSKIAGSSLTPALRGGA